jgi:hypothetical protein
MLLDIDEEEIINVLPLYNQSLEFPKYEYGLTGDFDINKMLRLIIATNSKSIFEFGTWFGRTTKILAGYIDDVWTIDICKEEVNLNTLPQVQIQELCIRDQIGECYRDSPNINRIHQLYGDTNKIGTIQKMRNAVPNKVDSCFVDANHNYCPVLCDSFTAMSITKKGGLLMWHDVKNGNLECGVDPALDILPLQIYHINHSWMGFAINEY